MDGWKGIFQKLWNEKGGGKDSQLYHFELPYYGGLHLSCHECA